MIADHCRNLTPSCFKKEARHSWRKQLQIWQVFLTWIALNLQACATAHFRRLYQVVRMMIKGFQSRFKVVCRSIYIYTDIPSRAITRRIRADWTWFTNRDRHWETEKHESLRKTNNPLQWNLILLLRVNASAWKNWESIILIYMSMTKIDQLLVVVVVLQRLLHRNFFFCWQNVHLIKCRRMQPQNHLYILWNHHNMAFVPLHRHEVYL